MTFKRGDRIAIHPRYGPARTVTGTVLGMEGSTYVNYREDGHDYVDHCFSDPDGYEDGGDFDNGDYYDGLDYHTEEVHRCSILEKKPKELTGFARFMKKEI